MSSDQSSTTPGEPSVDTSKASKDPEAPIEPEVFDKLPPDAKRLVEMSLTMARFSGPMPNPLLEKISGEHIGKIIENTEKDSERQYKDIQSARKYALAYVAMSILLFGFIIVYLADRNPTLLKEILVVLGIFAGGFGSGYGVKAYKDRDR